jgi:phosphoglycolate phosphatase
MDNLKHIIFDFDGTIVDTLELAFKIYNDIAPQFGCNLVERGNKEALRAKKPQDFLKKYGVSTLKLPFLVLKMRAEISKRISEVELVTGMKPVLHEIKDAGYDLGIVTSNSSDNVKTFLKNNRLDGVFDFIFSNKHVFGKHTTLLRLLKTKNIQSRNAVYIGDETRDIEAAKAAGIPIVAVTWGFNSREILATLLPDGIANAPGELPGRIREMCNE